MLRIEIRFAVSVFGDVRDGAMLFTSLVGPVVGKRRIVDLRFGVARLGRGPDGGPCRARFRCPVSDLMYEPGPAIAPR